MLESSEVEDVELAVGDHLVGDLGQESGHSLVSVVVSSDSVDHLDAVHQSWKSLFDAFWISFVKWFDELFEGLEILNVILGFVQSLGNSKLDSSPSGGGEVDLVSWFAHLLGSVLGGSAEYVVDSSAVLASELLRDTCELSHLLFPVVELLSWVALVIFLLDFLGSIKAGSDGLAPLVEKFLEVVDHLVRWCLGAVNVLGLVLPLSWVFFEVNVL